MKFGQNVPWLSMRKSVGGFLIFQTFFLLRALNWRRLANIQFAKFKVDFLGNQSEYRKSLTIVVYHPLIDIMQFVWSYVRAGRQVIPLSK